MKILCVDDTKAVHAYIRSLFAGLPHQIVPVFDGQQALDELAKSGFSGYDVVLLDWEMPVKNGLETLAEIRKINPDLQVVMVTSKNDVNDIIRMLESGANEYVMKPFTKDVLFDKISTLLGKEVA
jgi:two-component system chemotaxis response regulator CheY